MKKPWSGRFKQSTDKLMEKFSASISFDRRLYAYDIAGSIAHCQMLAKCKIISQTDSKKIIGGLKRILKEFESGKFQCNDQLEDIHMNIESRLTELVGSVGGKLHTARSRNDQVCLDIRLYLRDEGEEVVQLITLLAKTLLSVARKHTDTIIPGFTHMQQAQPILLAHHLLAYIEMLVRDRERMQDTLKRINIMPLGSAALAGTGFPIDRKYTSKLLNFPETSHNSIDAVSDRDFAIEFIFVLSLTGIHLSRLAEEVILWSSQHFNFVKLPDELSTGSSIMPQKKNPDGAELVRANASSVISNLNNILSLLKGLPLSYSKDLQDDKRLTFNTYDNVLLGLQVMAELMNKIKFNKKTMLQAVEESYATSTDLADWLVKKLHYPFREAYQITGKIVDYANSKNKSLSNMSLKELQKFDNNISNDGSI